MQGKCVAMYICVLGVSVLALFIRFID